MGHDVIHLNGFCPPYPLWMGPHFSKNRPVSNGAIYRRPNHACPMLTELYIEALVVDKELADQVWELWDKGMIPDDLAAWAGWLTWRPYLLWSDKVT